MADEHDALMTAIENDDVATVKRLLASGIDLNLPCDQGATVLFCGVLQGNIDIVRRLLAHGADPNFEAHEPACDIYAPKPLDLALQARFLWDWAKFHPIVAFLQESGATDCDGNQETPDDFAIRRSRAFDPVSGPQRRNDSER